MFHKLEKVTLVTSSCSAETNYHAFVCSCMKPLVPRTSMITSSSTFTDYVQETYSELQCHLFLALQTFLLPQYIRTLLSENGQGSFCSLYACQSVLQPWVCLDPLAVLWRVENKWTLGLAVENYDMMYCN
jgi:hypothetical protein